MATDPYYQRLVERSWRHKLTPAEQAELDRWLAAHPEAQPDWETESALSEALRRMLDVPVSNDFTSRVLRAVERADSREGAERRPWFAWSWAARWLPRAALAAVVVAAGFGSYHQTRVIQRAGLVHGVSAVSGISSLPSPEILQDFDAICALNRTPRPDEDLLKLME